MKRSHTWLISAGALVLALTNAFVLVGVVANRRPPPQSVFALTERELRPQWSWMWREAENSGLNLRLQYRVETVRNSRLTDVAEEDTVSGYGNFGAIAWLDRDKLAALGFDVPTPPTGAYGDTQYARMLGRDVLLVFEMDGPAHDRALQAARDRLALREREIAADPGREGIAQRLQSARQRLQIEEQEASRLFIVDAGLDETTLRQRYADRTHYAIVHGNVRPFVIRDGASAKIYGVVTAVRCESINVPLQFRATVPIQEPPKVISMGSARAEKIPPFTMQVAFGNHLEPWIMSARARAT